MGFDWYEDLEALCSARIKQQNLGPEADLPAVIRPKMAHVGGARSGADIMISRSGR
jgi:hypothetical protein